MNEHYQIYKKTNRTLKVKNKSFMNFYRNKVKPIFKIVPKLKKVGKTVQESEHLVRQQFKVKRVQLQNKLGTILTEDQPKGLTSINLESIRQLGAFSVQNEKVVNLRSII